MSRIRGKPPQRPHGEFIERFTEISKPSFPVIERREGMPDRVIDPVKEVWELVEEGDYAYRIDGEWVIVAAEC